MPCDEERGWRVSSRPIPRMWEWLPIRSTVMDRSLVSATVDTAFCLVRFFLVRGSYHNGGGLGLEVKTDFQKLSNVPVAILTNFKLASASRDPSRDDLTNFTEAIYGILVGQRINGNRPQCGCK